MWKPPEDQVITDTGWRPPADKVNTEPEDMRRWDQKAADFVQPFTDALGKAQSAIPVTTMLAENVSPVFGAAYYGANKINEAAGSVAAPVAEFAGQHGANPYVGAGLGMAASIAVNPLTYVNPSAGIAGKVLKPVIPAERAFDVATAQKYGLPMTRADLTGGVGAARVETGLSGTLTGGSAFQKIAAEKLAAIERAKTYIASRFGTDQPLSASGAESRLGMQSEMGTAGQTAQKLYKDVPDVQIQVGTLDKSMNELDYGAIDKGAASTIQEIRSRLGNKTPETETTVPTMGAEYSVKPKAPDLPIMSDAANATGEPYAVFQGNMDLGAEGKYSTYILRGDHPRTGGNFNAGQLSEMGIKVKGKTQRAAEMGHEPLDLRPETLGGPPAAHGFQKLNDIRNLLSKEIQSDTTYNPIMGNQTGPKAQTLVPLKKALDADIKNYPSTVTDPIRKAEAADFQTAFTKANSYYGTLKNLKQNKLVQKLSRVPESDIPKTVFGSGRIEDINVAKSALGDAGFKAAKKQFFNDLLESKNIDTKLSKYEPEFLSGVFNSEELNALKEAASLKKTSLTAEKLAGNPSGTAQRLASFAAGGGLAHAGYKAVTQPVAAAVEATAILGLPYAASKAYLGTTHGIPYSFGRGSAIATKAGALGASSSSNKKDVQAEFIRRYVKRVE
jgi:hypothetical protein